MHICICTYIQNKCTWLPEDRWFYGIMIVLLLLFVWGPAKQCSQSENHSQQYLVIGLYIQPDNTRALLAVHEEG